MEREKLSLKNFLINPFDLFERQWLLLTAGDYSTGKFNAMTIAWGSIGQMWSKPFVMVVVRPTRYTYQFINEYATFTLCAFPGKYHKALAYLGSKSGRDGDKIKASGLTPIPSHTVQAPGFAEANLIIECKKLYWNDLQAEHFLDLDIDGEYPEKDYHRMYFGEVVDMYADPAVYTK